MAFRFRYGNLLSYRQHLKEKAELDLGRAQQRLNSARQLLQEYEAALSLARQELGSRLKERMSSNELKTHTDYMGDLNRRIGAQKLLIVERVKDVKEATARLLLKTKEFKVIEKLQEKDYEKWEQDQARLEQQRMNEIAVLRYGKEFLGAEKSLSWE